MIYGQIKKLLLENYEKSDKIVLIESYFFETTRSGKHLRSVILGLTNKNLAIASMVYCIELQNNDKDDQLKYDKQLKLYYLYSLDVVKISIFKRHIRKSFKVNTTHGVRYFQIADKPKSKIYWDLWCIYVTELNSESKLWPFKSVSGINTIETKTWLDPCLYFGQKRAIEDQTRPVPIPGLGDNEEIKLRYVKPLYFGCWDQSEHWIQCGYNAMISMMTPNNN